MTNGILRSMIFALADVLVLPTVFLAALPMRLFRRVGAERLPMSRRAFRACGYWPLRRHYYDPLIDPRDLSTPLDRMRDLPAVEWNEDAQLELLAKLRFRDELEVFRTPPAAGQLRFHYDNRSFVSGDADFLYSFVRHVKPRRVVEVGCGNSTLLIHAAAAANAAEVPGYALDHVCIEPYEQPWLEKLGVRVVREKVEHASLEPFLALGPGDLLFIDSSHVIRPGGDVLYQVLELLPRLRSGVFIHFHDVFSPGHYIAEWITDRGYLWNEQYLLEAFLSFNNEFRIVAALNFLQHRHTTALAAICAAHDPGLEPGSIYLERV
jgi:predicted O-methyltransferase YrrM